MSTKRKTPATPAELPVPAEGGTWLRQPDGSLVRAPVEPPAAPASDPAEEADR